MPAAALRVTGLTMQFEGLTAVNDVDLEVPAGQIRGLIGPNGAGKTTCFNCLTGFYTPTSGEIWIDDQRSDGLASYEVSALGVSRTFQNIRLFSNMTAIENVLVGGHSHTRVGGREVLSMRRPTQHRLRDFGKKLPGIFPAGLSGVIEVGGAISQLPPIRSAEREAVASARSFLDAVGLKGRENIVARNLPYGDQRRLEIARALATRPRLLLLDEPTAGMNPQESIQVMELIRRVRDDFDTTVILIEHQMRVVMGVCEFITVLDYGKKIAEGTAAEVQRDPDVIEAYLGSRGAGEQYGTP